MTVGLGLGVSLALGLGACGGSPATSGASAVGTASSSVFSTCDTETRALPYQARLHVNSSAGSYQVKLVETLPSALAGTAPALTTSKALGCALKSFQ
jgi:hypothetical protein